MRRKLIGLLVLAVALAATGCDELLEGLTIRVSADPYCCTDTTEEYYEEVYVEEYCCEDEYYEEEYYEVEYYFDDEWYFEDWFFWP